MRIPKPLPRIPRSRAFFGLHFDFHAGDKSHGIGSRSFACDLDVMLRRVRPDYVQCDCKGHPGFSSYPTRVGNPAPDIEGDTLKVWRRVTALRGVSLYMHYSGVWDAEAVRRHPSWGRRDEKGRLDGKNTSVFGPYANRLLLPQLQELRDDYDVDGYWIDGECWATCQDYGKAVLRLFREATGIRSVPRKPEDPYFFEFTEFCREGFRRYLRDYVDVIHARCPGVEVASNWAFSSFMPEPVTASVDFLSGDYTLIDSVNSARLEGRCLMHQGKPWDLMAWAFSAVYEDPCRTAKTSVQLEREAAMVLSLGGGFQMYFKQRPDGSFNPHEIPLMETVARFCRDREAVCHGARSVPQIALLYSGRSYYRLSPRIFSPWGGQLDALHGTLNALLHNQCSVDVVSEHHLAGRMADFPVIIIPEWTRLAPRFRRELLAYVRQGGRLLVTGSAAVARFSRELGITARPDPEEKNRWLELDGQLAGIRGRGLDIRPRKGTRVVARWFSGPAAPEDVGRPAAVLRRYGRGAIMGLGVDFGARYRHQATAQARRIFGSLVRELFPEPMVELRGSHDVDLSLMEKAGTLRVNLVNTSGPHDNTKVYTHDEINPLGPLEILLRLPRKPRRIVLHPEARSMAFKWSKGEARVTLPCLKIHCVLEVVPA